MEGKMKLKLEELSITIKLQVSKGLIQTLSYIFIIMTI